jgi:hypothetical protein
MRRPGRSGWEGAAGAGFAIETMRPRYSSPRPVRSRGFIDPGRCGGALFPQRRSPRCERTSTLAIGSPAWWTPALARSWKRPAASARRGSKRIRGRRAHRSLPASGGPQPDGRFRHPQSLGIGRGGVADVAGHRHLQVNGRVCRIRCAPRQHTLHCPDLRFEGRSGWSPPVTSSLKAKAAPQDPI